MAEERIRPDYLDELLFAKFAELDHNVAILREEMDRIASLLERRKRAADEAVTDFLPADDVQYACSSPGFSQETTPLSLGANYCAIPSTEHHNQAKNWNGQTKHACLAFHSYRRLAIERITPSRERAEQIPTMQAFENVMDMLDSSARFILSKKNYSLSTTIGKPELFDEEPPSDPDDSVVEDELDQTQTK